MVVRRRHSCIRNTGGEADEKSWPSECVPCPISRLTRNPVDMGMIGDAKPSIAELVDIIRGKVGAEGRKRPQYTCTGRGRKVDVPGEMDAQADILRAAHQPVSCDLDLMNTVDREKTVMAHEAGSPRDQTTPFYEATVPHGYMGWGKTTQLGMSLGLMQGAKLAKPDWTCVHVMGDAAIGMTGMDFETAARLKIGTITIVLKNSIMGAIPNIIPCCREIPDRSAWR